MRRNGLLIGQRLAATYPRRMHDGRIAVEESNIRWCSDGFEITCLSKEKVRLAFALDCHDREAMSWVATTKRIDSAMIRERCFRHSQIRLVRSKHLLRRSSGLQTMEVAAPRVR